MDTKEGVEEVFSKQEGTTKKSADKGKAGRHGIKRYVCREGGGCTFEGLGLNAYRKHAREVHNMKVPKPAKVVCSEAEESSDASENSTTPSLPFAGKANAEEYSDWLNLRKLQWRAKRGYTGAPPPPPAAPAKAAPAASTNGVWLKAKRRFMCTQEGCEYGTDDNRNMQKHLRNKHNIGVVWYPCNQDGCCYEAKEKSILKRHLANKHDIGVTWYTCPQPGCGDRFKESGNLTRHLALVHDIGGVWYDCPQCSFRTKQRGNLKRHSQLH